MIRNIFRLNWIATARMNYCAGGIRAVLRLPIRVYGKLRLHLSGRIILPDTSPIPTLIIGAEHEDYHATAGCAQICVLGTWRIGGGVQIGPDCFIGVGRNASLEMGSGDCFGRNTQIHCSHRILFGQNVFAGEFYATDSTEHQIVRDGVPQPLTGEIMVGDETYMGFRVMLLKGCRIPSRSVVASGAVVTKDFCPQGEGLFLTGVPATVKSTQTRAEKDICSR